MLKKHFGNIVEFAEELDGHAINPAAH